MTTEGEASPPSPWKPGWDAPDEERLRRAARVSLAEKLEWLERMHRMALTLRAARERRSDEDA